MKGKNMKYQKFIAVCCLFSFLFVCFPALSYSWESISDFQPSKGKSLYPIFVAKNDSSIDTRSLQEQVSGQKPEIWASKPKSGKSPSIKKEWNWYAISGTAIAVIGVAAALSLMDSESSDKSVVTVEW